MKKLALLLGICSILIFAGIASADTLVKTTETNFGYGLNTYTGSPRIFMLNDTTAFTYYQWDASADTYELDLNSTSYYTDHTFTENGGLYHKGGYMVLNVGSMFNLSDTYYLILSEWDINTWQGYLKLCNFTGTNISTDNCRTINDSRVTAAWGIYATTIPISDNEAWIYYAHEIDSSENWTFFRTKYYKGNDTLSDAEFLFNETFDYLRVLNIYEFNSTYYLTYSHYSDVINVRNSSDGSSFGEKNAIFSGGTGEIYHNIFYTHGKYHLTVAASDFPYDVALYTSDSPDEGYSFERWLVYDTTSPYSVGVSGDTFLLTYLNMTAGEGQYSIAMQQWEYVPFVLNFVPPTPDSGSYTNQLDFTVNVSADTSLSDCWLDFQGLNLTMTVNGDYCYFTKSLSVNNCFSYKVYANSTASDLVVTPTRSICQDNSPPLVTIISPQNITYNTTNISLEVSANDTIDTWWYSLNGGANTTFSPNTTITGTEGSNEIIVYANDTAGNTGSDTEYFTITIPSLNITWNTPANNSFTLNLSSILWNATLGNTPNTCILNINGTANYSMLISGNDCYYTTSSLTNQTTYCGIIYANNSIYNISSMRCATINLTSGGFPPTPPRPIDNMGMFGGIALLVMGAGIILFLLEGIFGSGALLRNPKGIMLIIIGAIIMAAMILALL